MSSEHFCCPFCNHDSIVRDFDKKVGSSNFLIGTPADGHKQLVWSYILCPNMLCRKATLRAGYFDLEPVSGDWMPKKRIHTWNLIPSSSAKVFPDYVPKPVRDDYQEACLIADLSPKASATLARRCLQGIIRDYWGVKTGRLVDEILQIRDRTDPLTWDAIESVRSIGNIGAHMEKDINVIIDVDPEEAQTLIGLIEILIKDWYVAREDRRIRLLAIKSIANEKVSLKSPASPEHQS